MNHPSAILLLSALVAPACAGDKEEIANRIPMAREPLADHLATVRVVTGADQRPVEGAIVRWFARTAEEEHQSEHGAVRTRDHEPLAEYQRRALESGTELRTDADGLVAFPCPKSIFHVVATRDDLWGRTVVGCSWYLGHFEEGERELEVFANRPLAVQVQRTDGSAAVGVPVALRSYLGDFAQDWLVAVTDDEGVAVLEYAGHAYQWELARAARYSKSSTLRWNVALELYLSQRVEVPFDPAAWPGAPLQLVLPPTGEVEVILRNPDGAPCDVEMSLALVSPENAWAPGRVGRNAWITNMDGWVHVGGVVAPWDEGRALFRHIGLGQEFVVLARRNLASRTYGIRGEGPRAEGERVAVEVVLGEGDCMFTGRIVDPQGRALASSSLGVELFSGPSSRRLGFANRSEGDTLAGPAGGLFTGVDGRFVFDISVAAAFGGVPYLVLTHDPHGLAPLTARLDLTKAWGTGRHDLGEVRLLSPPHLASGHVVDEGGASVAEARVSVLAFKDFPRVITKTDSTGAFHLHTAEPHGEFSIRVDKKGYESSQKDGVQVGDTDLRFELVRPSKD